MKRKLNELIRENLRLRHDYLKRRVKLTEENVKGEMLILLFMKLANILNPREWNSIAQITCLIKLKGKRHGRVKN